MCFFFLKHPTHTVIREILAHGVWNICMLFFLVLFHIRRYPFLSKCPSGPDMLSAFGPGSGCFFYRSGSGQTRAHLASLLLLCPNTCRPHMYCMKYCYNNYIINILHRLCNRLVCNAYTQALAYSDSWPCRASGRSWSVRSYYKFPMLREKLHFGRVLSVLIFVGMIVGGGSYVWSL